MAERDDQLRMKEIKLHDMQTQLDLAQKDARATQGERDRLQIALEEYRVNHLAQLEHLKTSAGKRAISLYRSYHVSADWCIGKPLSSSITSYSSTSISHYQNSKIHPSTSFHQ